MSPRRDSDFYQKRSAKRDNKNRKQIQGSLVRTRPQTEVHKFCMCVVDQFYGLHACPGDSLLLPA